MSATMKSIPINEMWLVHPSYSPPMPVLLRRSGVAGAEVFGGKTGSHRTGHGESYWDKFKELIALGYVPVDVAKELGVISQHWEPPPVDTLEKSVASKAYLLKK